MSLPIEIELPQNFLEEEERCGYVVTAKQKKVWAVELDLLSKLLDVCKKHDIKVQVFAGTLLGAVRHKGFIPWDDDIDVALTRTDFKKLCDIAAKEFKYPYFFQTALTDRKFFFATARLRNSDTTGIISGYESPDYNNGIYIDIFPLDGLPDSQIRETLQIAFMRIAFKLCSTYVRDAAKNYGLIEILSRVIRPILRLFPYKMWVGLCNMVLSMWNLSSERFGLRTHFKFGKKYWLSLSEFNDAIEMDFEGISVMGPRRYDNVLSRMYGEYLKYPPKECRGLWHSGHIRFNPDISYKDFFKEEGIKI